jgi:hypothetical protein
VAIICYASVVLLAAALDAEIALREESPIVAAAVSFAVSFPVFQLLAWSTFYAEKGWRAVDYLWVGAAAITIVIATAKVDSEAQRRTLLNTASGIADSIDRMSSMCRKVDSVFESSQAGTEIIVLAEAPVGSRISHITYDCSELDAKARLIRDVISSPAWPEAARSLDSDMSPLCEGKLVIRGRAETDESRQAVAQVAKPITERRDEICEARDRVERIKQQRFRAQQSDWQRYLTEPGRTLSGWYVVLAFAVGIRLGKVTAEILQRMAPK